ncbi:MAG TPA: hypothetical protein VEJ41_10135 [Candidatus Acidoferrales bacterium]|nr:hypothetical protein [Candidatus Acidoferrales bacterium]
MSVRWFSMLGGLTAAVIAAGSVALSASAPTVEKTPAPVPPKPNFSSMNFLLGNWTCSTKSARRPAAYITTSVTTIDPTGYWMVTKSLTKAMAWFPYPTNTTDLVTYDPTAKRWVDVFSGDFGAYDVTTAPGWTGHTIVWTDQLFVPGPDIMAQTPTTVTKVSATKTTAHSTFRERSSGRWIAVDTVCTKNS